MRRPDLEIYGPGMECPEGFVASVGNDEYRHRFGGAAWQIIDMHQVGDGPTLLLTLDLEDPRLNSVRSNDLVELPLCAYLNCISIGRQSYSIDQASKTISLLERRLIGGEPVMLDSRVRLPNPIPEKPLCFRPMEQHEYPVDEDRYWAAGEEFLGGNGVIRIVGPPLWLECVEEEICDCGRSMNYIASIGYELSTSEGSETLLGSAPFFPGEFGLYFFLCGACSIVVVNMQST